MCGIVGIIQKYTTLFDYSLEIFTELLFLDQVRGRDGTGIFYNLGDKVWYMKQPNNASQFIAGKGYKRALGSASKSGNFIIGHNRAMSKGGINHACTHPFSHDGITLVHNGTIRNQKELGEAQVDSETICMHMGKNGYQDTLSKIEGAFSLVWYNSEEQSLNLARNHERPLFLLESMSMWVISSEQGLGKWVLERNSQKVESSILVPTGELFKFNKDNLKEYEKIKFDFYKPTYVPYYQGGYQHFNHDQGVLPLPAPANSEGTRRVLAWGESVKFYGERIIENNSVKIKFLTCSIVGSSLKNEIKIEEKDLEEGQTLEDLEKAGVLKGIVSASVIRGNKRTYTVKEIKIVTKEDKCSVCDATFSGEEDKVYDADYGFICKDCSQFANPINNLGYGGVWGRDCGV